MPNPSQCLTEDQSFQSLLERNFENIHDTENFIHRNHHQLPRALSPTLVPTLVSSTTLVPTTSAPLNDASTTYASNPVSSLTLVPSTAVSLDLTNDENYTETQVIPQTDAVIHSTIVYDHITINVAIDTFFLQVESSTRIQSYYGIDLLLSHFKCLMPEVMLNDEVINMYAELLRKNYCDDKMCILNSLTSNKLNNFVLIMKLSKEELECW